MIFCHIKYKSLYITSEFKLTLKETQFTSNGYFCIKIITSACMLNFNNMQKNVSQL